MIAAEVVVTVKRLELFLASFAFLDAMWIAGVSE